MAKAVVGFGVLFGVCAALLVGALAVGRVIGYPFAWAGRNLIPLTPPFAVAGLLPTEFADADQANRVELHSTTTVRLLEGQVNFQKAGAPLLNLSVILHGTGGQAADVLRYNAQLMHSGMRLYQPDNLKDGPYLFFAGSLPGLPFGCRLQYVNNQRWVITLEAPNCATLFAFMRIYRF